MKLAIMQPYFFPYAGYFSLVAAVDRFVFYDDVQYIKNGWINRNRILIGGAPKYITVPLRHASASSHIDEVAIADGAGWKRKMIESLRHSYGGARYFGQIDDLVRGVVMAQFDRISDMAKASVCAVARYLELPADFVQTSTDYGNSNLQGVERVIDICRRESADAYVNLPGGRALYDEAQFAEEGIALRFVEPAALPYPQFSESFQPFLSIIDVLMHNPPDRVRSMLADCIPG